MQYNKMILGGTLVTEPELKYAQSGTAILKGRVASNRRYSVKGEKREDVLYLDFTAWGKTAETIDKHFSKGRKIFLEGDLRMDNWEDKEGRKRTSYYMNVQTFQFVSDGSATTREERHSSVSGGDRTASQHPAPEKQTDYGDIPF